MFAHKNYLFQMPFMLDTILITISITSSFHIFMFQQSGWQITAFFVTKSIYLSLTCQDGFQQGESRIYSFYDKKVVICHRLRDNINMWKLLVMLVVIKLYALIDMFNNIDCSATFLLILQKIFNILNRPLLLFSFSGIFLYHSRPYC